MAEIKYTHKMVIQLSGEEDVINEYTPNYAVVINNTDDTVYISKESNIAQKIDTNKVKAILPGMAEYLAGEKGVNDRFFALGKGPIRIKEAATIHECLEILSKYHISLYGANYSNPNLLINPDFKINQRGRTSYSGTEYTLDCWEIISENAEITVDSDNGITFSSDGSSWAEMRYTIENIVSDTLEGKHLTLSAVVDGKYYSKSTAIPFDRSQNSTPISIDCGTFSIGLRNIPTNTNPLFVRIGSSDKINVCIEHFKLEIGSVATSFCPPDPLVELVKCQRYYQVRTTGNIDIVDLRPSMCNVPVISQLADGKYSYSSEL